MFDGRADEAIDFYRDAVGAKLLMKMRFDESPDPIPPGMLPPGAEKKVMHAELDIHGSTVRISDGSCTGKPNFGGASLSIDLADEASVRRTFDALAQGGQITMPLGKTFWSPCFGALTDRFGLGWMVMVAEPQS
jgi:PhnB protein